jgi:hypothetical protein
MKRILLGLATVLLGLVTAANGQDQPNGPDQANGQAQADVAPGTARVSMIRGDVSTLRGDSQDWNAATLNTPVMEGDQVSTAANSRAEIQLDYANTLRLDQNSVARIAALNQTQIQVQVAQGLVSYTVLNGSEASAEIDTPNVAIHPLQDGSYRIEVISDGETHVIVRHGEAEITTPQGSTRVEEGQMISIQGTGDDAQYQTIDAPQGDDWDRWNGDRDGLITHADSWRHTDRYYVGTQDLDTYGRWQSVPDYGDVWVPAQRADWAPYRDGRWVWEPYYGWTWVSYEPWGWAPYHYGRWFVYGGSWAWWPGPVVVGVGLPLYRPVWAPAYVSFFGFGDRVGFGFGFGSVGWLPTGPRDGFFPWYGRSGNRVNVVNMRNITNIRNSGGIPPLLPDRHGRGISNVQSALTNERTRRGISSMPAEKFGKGAVPSHTASIDANTLRQGGMLTGRVPIAPTRESYRSVNRPARPGTIPPRAGNAQHFFSKAQAGAGSRPFNRQATPGTSHTSSSAAVGARSPATTSNARTQPERSAPLGSRPSTGARPFSSPGAGSVRNNPPSRTDSSERPGWHRFGSENSNSSARPYGAGSSQPGTRGQFTAPAQPNRGSSPATSGGSGWFLYSRPSNTSRPPLNLHQPIVTQRSQSPYGNGQRSGYGAGPYRPPSTNSYRPPSGNSYPPQSGGTYRPPAGGSYRPPSGGSYRPPSGGSYRPPSGGSYRPPSGGSSRPPSGGSSRPPSGGSSGHPHSSGGSNHGGGGHPSPPSHSSGSKPPH